MNRTLLGIAAAAAFVMTSGANAALIVKIDEITAGDLDAAVVVADNSALDSSAAIDGLITNTTSTNNFNVVTSTAFGSELLAFPDIFDLAANVLSSGAGVLQISLTETGLSQFDAAGLSGGGSIAIGGTGTFDLYVGATNGEFETSSLITTGSFGGGSFTIDTGLNDFASFINGDFSLTLVTTLVADSSGDFFSTDVKVVPVPATLALFGLGLLGLGAVARKKKQA